MSSLENMIRRKLEKRAIQPMPAGAPTDPMMQQAVGMPPQGGAPQGGMPMDPSMAGADPMAGAMPQQMAAPQGMTDGMEIPMDPTTGQPMDPNSAGLPPQPGAPGDPNAAAQQAPQEQEVVGNMPLEQFVEMLGEVVTEIVTEVVTKEVTKIVKEALSDLPTSNKKDEGNGAVVDKLDQIVSILGGTGPAAAAEQMMPKGAATFERLGAISEVEDEPKEQSLAEIIFNQVRRG